MSDTLSLYLHGLVQSLSKVARAVTHTLHCVTKIQSTSHMTQLKPVTAICTFTFTCKFVAYMYHQQNIWVLCLDSYQSNDITVGPHLTITNEKWPSMILLFERINVIEVCNKTMFDFYPGLPHVPPPTPQLNLLIYLYFEHVHVQPWV